MSFFGDVPEPVTPTPQPEPEPMEIPSWLAPPKHVSPGISDQRCILFHTDYVAMVLDRFQVFETGLLFVASVSYRTPQNRSQPRVPWDLEEQPEPWGSGENVQISADDIMRFGIQFSDETKWTNVDSPSPEFGTTSVGWPSRPEVYVQQAGASYGPDGCEARMWLSPLPPEGDLTFVAKWPSLAIEECVATVDATALRATASTGYSPW